MGQVLGGRWRARTGVLPTLHSGGSVGGVCVSRSLRSAALWILINFFFF